jgi:MFS superfamily sulfate permease-like transporter
VLVGLVVGLWVGFSVVCGLVLGVFWACEFQVKQGERRTDGLQGRAGQEW